MTRFASPALHHPDLRLSPALVRTAFALVALVLTAGLWFVAGAEAGHFGDGDQTPRFELEPVVISGHRLLPENPAIAMGSAAAIECGNTPAGAGSNRVTLNQ